MLKPRLHRYDSGTDSLAMGDPGNAIMGLFTLWWGWLVFNTGSSFGITGNKWQYSGRAAINTINASLGGGIAALLMTWLSLFETMGIYSNWCYMCNSGQRSFPFLDRLNIDDPVGAVAVHGVGGILGMTAVGLFVEEDPLLNMTGGLSGLFKGGGFYFLSVQLLSCVCIATWSMSTTFLLLKAINLFIPIRMTEAKELLGADFNEHNIRHDGYDYDAMSQQLIRQGYKMELPKINAPSRHEWDKYLLDKYFESQVQQEQILQNGHRRAWTERPKPRVSRRNIRKK
ncbi:ammonium transporter 2 [Caerostris extrusa]|uniref:Ammonium transporter 2 n=1 Tax=Caerostris extrusa TaxID=172846 RepID=A0AAV4MKV2_CAEEX|nr:ammonium transporter 2 [Caerostris extrusa]